MVHSMLKNRLYIMNFISLEPHFMPIYKLYEHVAFDALFNVFYMIFRLFYAIFIVESILFPKHIASLSSTHL